MTSEEYELAKLATVRETQEKTNEWLRKMGFWREGQTRAGLMKELAEFRRTSVQKPAGKDWARILLSRVLDGEKLPIVCEQFAREALRIPALEEAV